MQKVGKRERQPVTATLPAGPATPSRLLKIRDPTTHVRFLIDTGATVSVLPVNRQDRRRTSQYNLRAANGSDIATYGTRSLTISLDPRRTFTWVFIVADVEQAIIGVDFLHARDLVINLRGRSIQDSTTQYSTVASIMPVPSPVRPVTNLLSAPQPVLSSLLQFLSITGPQSLIHYTLSLTQVFVLLDASLAPVMFGPVCTVTSAIGRKGVLPARNQKCSATLSHLPVRFPCLIAVLTPSTLILSDHSLPLGDAAPC